MKKNIFTVVISCCLLLACNHSKKTTTSMATTSKLAGTWVLNYITGPRIAFDGLYPDKKPTITFDITNNMVSGNASCNNFSGKLNADGNKISFTNAMALTKMMCINIQGETVFLEMLKKVNTWSVTDDNTLNFIMGDVAIMRFTKK
jgi:heat shock protein HslJ